MSRGRSRMSRSRFIFASSRFIAAFSRLPESSAPSFASDSLVFLARDLSTRNEEDIIMPTINKSIHRATITLDVPAKIADVILYATNIVQKMTGNPSFPRVRGRRTSGSTAPTAARPGSSRRRPRRERPRSPGCPPGRRCSSGTWPSPPRAARGTGVRRCLSW